MDTKLPPAASSPQWLNAPQTLSNTQQPRKLDPKNKVYQLHELKPDAQVDPKSLYQDGLDEVVVKTPDGKQYMAYGKDLPEIDKLLAGDKIQLSTPQGQAVIGEISFVDSELTSFGELGRSMKEKPANYLSLAAIPYLAFSVLDYLAESTMGESLIHESTAGSLGSRLNPINSPFLYLGAVTVGAAVAGLTYFSVHRHVDDQAVKALLK